MLFLFFCDFEKDDVLKAFIEMFFTTKFINFVDEKTQNYNITISYYYKYFSNSPKNSVAFV